MDLTRMRLSSLFPINQPPVMGDPNTPYHPMDEIPRPNMDVSSPNTGPTDQRSFGDQVLYQPEHSGIDKMSDMIAHMPERNHPGLLRKIFGGLAQAVGGGPEAYDHIVYKPYHDAMADWNAKYQPTKALADAERGSNTVNRQFATSVMNNETAGRRQEETERNNRARNAVSAQRASIADYKARHPNHVFRETKDGKIVSIDPQTNDTETLLDSDGQPLQSANLSAEQKQEYAIKLIQERALQAGKLEGTRQKYRLDLENERQENRTENIDHRADVKTKSGTGMPDPGKEKIDQYNRAQAAFNTHPNWQKWIDLQDPGTNTFTLKTPDKLAPSMFSTGKTDEWNKNKYEYADILGEIYGPERKAAYLASQKLPDNGTKTTGSAPAKSTTATPTPSKTDSNKEVAPKSPKAGWHYEKAPDGTKWIAVKDK